jgi:apolipoprotein N-acyltransferase
MRKLRSPPDGSPWLWLLGWRPWLGFFAGAITVLAWAPVDWFWMASIGPALWWWSLLGLTPRAAARQGYLFGLGLFGFGVSWVFNSLLIFGQAPLPMALVLTLALVLYLAVYPALLAALVAVAVARLGSRFKSHHVTVLVLLALAGGWIWFEYLRGLLFTGFPWLYLGHAALDSPLQPLLPVGGDLGASLAFALLAVGLVLLVQRRFFAALGVVLPVVLVTALVSPVEWVRPSGPALNAGLVQANIEQDRKWAEDGIEHALDVYRALTEQVSGLDVLIWPETAIPAFSFEVAGEFLALAEAFIQDEVEWVTGIFDYDPVTRRMYNSLHVPTRGGVYHKRQLVPFGEYLPLREALGWLHRILAIPMADLSPGTGRGLLEVAGHAVGASICYEAAYARRIRTALPEASFLINVSNDAWFGRSLAPHQHLQIARVRAVEMGRPMLRGTNTGVSAIIRPDGSMAAASDLFEPAIVIGSVVPHAGLTPTAAHGPWPPLLLALALFLPLLLRVTLFRRAAW